MKRFHRYVPESDDLIRARVLERATSFQTINEAHSDEMDLIKDKYIVTGGVEPLVWTRRGVPLVFSSLYDA